MIANRVSNIAFSATMQINQKARQMRSQGIDVIDLSVQEPDFPTPPAVKQSAINAINDDYTKYTAAGGAPELLHAIVNYLKKNFGVSYQPNEIIVSNGAKHSLYNVFMAMINHGDEVIIPMPYWVSYPEQVKMAEGVPIFVETTEEDNFLLTAAQLNAVITDKSKALVLCNPSNPTGTVYSRKNLQELADVCMKHGITIVSDEIYSKLIYDNFEFVSVAQLGEEVKAHCVIINGMSKGYCMTGWRIGYAAGPAELIAAMGKIQSHSTSNPVSVSQQAAIAALQDEPAEVEVMRRELQKRRNYIYEKFKAIPRITVCEPHGGISVFPNISGYFNTGDKDAIIVDSVDFTNFLLERAHVAGVPGKAFGAERYIRISYANSTENIEKAMNRITEALHYLHEL